MPQQPTMLVETINMGLVQELIALWQSDLGELNPATRTSYRRGTAIFFDWLAGQDRTELNHMTVRAWLSGLSALGYKSGSINTWLVGLRSFFAWVHERGHIPFNPALGIRGIRRRGTTRTHRRDELTAGEVLAVLDTCNESKVGRRDYALLSLMAYAALRQGEIHRADIEDLKTQDGRQVLWVQGKGSPDKDDFVVLSPIAEEAIQDWLPIHPHATGALFVSFGNRNRGKRLSLRSIRQIVKERYIEAGIVDSTKTTHSLRHSAISAAIRNGASLTQVQAMARHSNINTTMIYFHETGRTSEPAEDTIQYRT
ncbi:MAG TPA: tyrosine-type recombinase/integrase [candidate division Zixibacteria bacterium]|nr:tyrosine-type recombinase/integrase [candidate division Zixibacteria bacterium]